LSTTLSQLIDQVRAELLAPRQTATPDSMYPFLFVEEVELEVAITVATAAEGGGKVNVQVVELGSQINRTNEEVHRLKIKLTPLYDKQETRQKLEADLGQQGTARMKETAKRGTVKEFPNG